MTNGLSSKQTVGLAAIYLVNIHLWLLLKLSTRRVARVGISHEGRDINSKRFVQNFTFNNGAKLSQWVLSVHPECLAPMLVSARG